MGKNGMIAIPLSKNMCPRLFLELHCIVLKKMSSTSAILSSTKVFHSVLMNPVFFNTYTHVPDRYRTAGSESWGAESVLTHALNETTWHGSTPLSFDADGNMLTNGVWSYEWDAENRLAAVSSNAVFSVSDRYDGWNRVEERIAYAGGTCSTNRYYWGKDLSGTLQGAGGVGGLVAVSIGGQYYFPCYDNLGNVVAYVDENGSKVATYTYDAFGNTLSSSGSMRYAFPHRFSTKYYDAETGLYYYGYRFYLPELGRWMNRDPIEERGGNNLYAFAEIKPLFVLDVHGANIYLVTGNDSGFSINDHYHQSICVDDPSSLDSQSKKTCFSFAYMGNWKLFCPNKKWLGWSSTTLGGYVMEGEIYETYFVGSVSAEKMTTAGQDSKWLSWMRTSRKGLKDVYSVARHNCRMYSQNEFDDAPGVIKP